MFDQTLHYFENIKLLHGLG